MTRQRMKYVAPIIVSLILFIGQPIRSEVCEGDKLVFGHNELIDQLLICSLAHSNDLDLTPSGDHTKVTSRSLTDLGFGNKTQVVSAKLSGLWTLKRAKFAQTSWRCNPDGSMLASAIIELNGLALDLIEKVDISLNRKWANHKQLDKSNVQKPCKTFNLPSSLCRQTKTIFRNTRTWVNQAYFNLTLYQNEQSSLKPVIQDLWLMFSCPETFRHKITYSPSASYILSRFTNNLIGQQELESKSRSMSSSPSPTKELSRKRTLQLDRDPENHKPIPGPLVQVTSQENTGFGGRSYQNSVQLILDTTIESLRENLGQCISKIDSDLFMVADHESFSNVRFHDHGTTASGARDIMPKVTSRCSNQAWLKQKTESAIGKHELERSTSGSQKRNLIQQVAPKAGLDELLDPYGYYHSHDMVLIDQDRDTN